MSVPRSCHSCQRFGHKMKFCNWYRWNSGHGCQSISWNSECDDYTLTDSTDYFIHASPLNDYDASRVDIGCVKVDFVGLVSYLLRNNLFRSVFEKRDVPKDGHCFIHALSLSLSTLSPDLLCLTYAHVLTLIKNEMNTNNEKYSLFLYDQGEIDTEKILNEYINDKNYNKQCGVLVSHNNCALTGLHFCLGGRGCERQRV